MYIKNTLRLFMNNINLGFKAMLYRLIVMIVGLISAYYIAYFGISVISKSAEISKVIQDLKSLWLMFLGHEDIVVDLQASFTALLTLVKANLVRIIGSLSAVIVVLFIMDYLLGLCNFTLGAMVNTYMTSLTKTYFIQTFVANIKKALVFELIYSLVKSLAIIISFAIAGCFAIFAYRALSFVSILIGLWLLICLIALFLSFTATWRIKVIEGAKIGSAIKNSNINKNNFFPIFATNILVIVLIFYVNVSMFLVTLGAGIMVTVPMTYLLLLCLQNVIEFTLTGRKYYIDYDNIVIPKELRGEEEKLLSEEVDI